MVITQEELQRRRSPSDLRKFVEDVRNAVSANPHELKEGILKKGLYKEFLDEISPLSDFAVLNYPSNFSIQPVLGNQGFDAIVYTEAEAIFERLELTHPHDGYQSSQNARHRSEHGEGKIHIGIPCDDFKSITPFVISTCKNKAQIDYSDAKLIVVVDTQPPFNGFESEYEKCIRELCKQVSQIRFNAAGVILFFPPERIERIAV